MGASAGRRGPRLHGDVTQTLIAGIFGHKRPPDPAAVAWFHEAQNWTAAHWTVLAVVIPVAGGIVAAIVNHYLAVARENRSRKISLRDVRARVHADLAARLLSHCTRLHQAAVAGQLDAAQWRDANENLHARAQRHDVVDALGKSYVAFMAAIEHERRAVGRDDPRRAAEAYVPFIASFGEPKQAKRLQRLLRDGGRLR